jgi:N-acetylglucosamine-6-phosphate deacetylase
MDATGLVIMPGFIDVHVHGGGGADVMDATPEALRTICRTHARYGTTSLLATTMTQSGPKIEAALDNARRAWEMGLEFCPDGAEILGVHLEGPYISPKRPGAQPAQYVRPYNEAEFDRWLQVSEGAMRLITLAPEEAGADTLISLCLANGIVVSLGHTDATAERTRRAIEAGAQHATHLFNAMPALHHRAPGAVAPLLADEDVTVEIIADGHHVAPEILQLALKAKGTSGVVLITDAMAGAGVGDGQYELGGNRVTVKDGKATLADGTLAGSVLTMNKAAQNARKWTQGNWTLLARLTATNAANRLGYQNKGRIAPGCDADFVVVDDDLNVHATFVAGRCVYKRGGN